MKNNHILNPSLIEAIASLGHTEYLGIGDAGLPMPGEASVIDLSVVRGVPSFLEVLEGVAKELVIESYILAEEIKAENPGLLKEIERILPGIPCKMVSHEELKAISRKARTMVRTGECSSYANILLIGGVNF